MKNKVPTYKVPNQIYPDLLGVCSLNPWIGHDSASRIQMFSSHIGQTLVVKGGTERTCQTGMEREYAKYTFSVKMPVDAEIIKSIQRYPYKEGPDAIHMNPQTVIIYEDANTKEVGMIDLRDYCSYHQYFGFEYSRKSSWFDAQRTGSAIKAGTVLLDSPSVTEDGGYRFGVQCNMAFMSHPAVSEDGILISSDVLKRFGFKTYETRVVEWGSKRFALNTYGDENTYKPFPDIGDRIREDGLLMALRPYNKELAMVEQGINDLREVDFIFDKLTYAAGAGGRVVDIRVHHDVVAGQGPFGGMDEQPEKYDRARRQFYQSILDVERRLRRERGDALRLTPELSRMIVEAQAVMDHDQQRIVKLYRQAPLDDWRVEFVIEYDITPTVGFKLTDCHGGKGVICNVAAPEQMPVDADGNRADIVMDPNSTISRMNIGRLYEQYINCAIRDAAKNIRTGLQVTKGERGLEAKLAQMETSDPAAIDRAWNYLMGLYDIVSPRMYLWMTNGQYKRSRTEHLAEIINKGIYLYLPTDNEPESENIVKGLEKHYRPTYGPVSYIGNSGRRVTTKMPVRIGEMYIILLEKIGDDWTAVSSGKVQHFGVLSQVTNTDKYATPSRNQAIRAWGEAEVRIGVSYVGPLFVADMMDRNNNLSTHRFILQRILNSEKPTDIPHAVDRNLIPLGGARPLQLVKHIAECSGWKFIYKPYVPNWQAATGTMQ